MSSNSSIAVMSESVALNLIVVRRSFGERLLEDRRIRRHSRQCVVTDTALEITVAENRPVDEVEPDRLARGVQALKRILCHAKLLSATCRKVVETTWAWR
jgi:hypothetical protein